jgi:hypothetical protein
MYKRQRPPVAIRRKLKFSLIAFPLSSALRRPFTLERIERLLKNFRVTQTRRHTQAIELPFLLLGYLQPDGYGPTGALEVSTIDYATQLCTQSPSPLRGWLFTHAPSYLTRQVDLSRIIVRLRIDFFSSFNRACSKFLPRKDAR